MMDKLRRAMSVIAKPPNKSRRSLISQRVCDIICGIDIPLDDRMEDIKKEKLEFANKIEVTLLQKDISFLRAIAECPICLEIPIPKYAVNISCCNKIWCAHCAWKHIKATKRCSLCTKIVQKELFSKVQILDGIIEEIYKNNASKQKNMCKIHSKKIIYFCDTCNNVLCATCLIHEHKKHDFVEIEDKYSKVKETMKQEAKRFNSNTNYINNLQKNISDIEEKSHQIRISIIQPSLNMLSSYFHKLNLQPWNCFNDLTKDLNRAQELQRTELPQSEALLAQMSFKNLPKILKTQKELESLNGTVESHKDKYERLIEDSPFKEENHIFEFKIDQSKVEMVHWATSKGLKCELFVQVFWDSVGIKLQRGSVGSGSGQDRMEKKYLVLAEYEVDIFGDNSKLMKAYKMLDIIPENTTHALMPPNTVSDHLYLKLIVYQYTPALHKYLKTSLTSTAELLKECQTRTDYNLKKLDY